jgi:hypothetical protein
MSSFTVEILLRGLRMRETAKVAALRVIRRASSVLRGCADFKPPASAWV